MSKRLYRISCSNLKESETIVCYGSNSYQVLHQFMKVARRDPKYIATDEIGTPDNPCLRRMVTRDEIYYVTPFKEGGDE